ncbi:enoyl-CoA hydratase/isomerase family protein [Paenibacillus nasutitermitis]|uniref:Crotonase n=1 Tax=Paenibacillus nasutitermitis TaxID=1652958 RepID=A0A917DPT0_9BACL|nr:enoyl-CoA hydratase/isomerase family protein [Paenibacillus nasutitermitis]GGD59361.1 crotonase [Paenibacillus nasutitermitis]
MRSSYKYLQQDEREGVLLATIRREEKLNAMNDDLMAELTDCFQRLQERHDIRAVVLTGTGKGFMAGADIEGYNGFDIGRFIAFQQKGRSLYRAVESCPQPVIAAVNGYALGGGFELVLSCDLVIASEKAKFGLPEVKLGLVPGGGGIQKIARIVGPFMARELTMTGRFVTAEEGKSLQFVNQVTEPDELLETATAFARTIADQAPLAVQALKRLIHEGRDASLETAQAYDRSYLANLFHSADGKEGIAAFSEKRTPNFTGK